MPSPRSRNRLLAALPTRDYQRLRPHLESITLTTKVLLAVEELPLDFAYFPETCVLSLLARTDPEVFVEVATVGREGMVGTPLLLGMDTSPHRCFCQIPGDCVRLSAQAFHDEVAQGGPFVSLLHRYMQMFIVQIAQGAACNGRHTVEQRCTRWLLMTHDRVGADEFPLTQEFLCQMLGVRRATVSEVASRFQAAGLIQYTRGRMRILDRAGLEQITCPCYRIIHEEYAQPLLAASGEARR